MQIIAVLADVLDGHDVHDAVSAAWSLLSNRLAAQAGVADPSPEYLAGLRRRLAARTSAASNSSRFTISSRSPSVTRRVNDRDPSRVTVADWTLALTWPARSMCSEASRWVVPMRPPPQVL